MGVFFLEDMVHDPAGLCRRLFLHLQVDAAVEVDVSTIHNLEGVMPRETGRFVRWRHR